MIILLLNFQIRTDMRKQLLLFLGITLLFLASCKQEGVKPDPEFARYITAFTYGNVSPDAFIEIELAQELPAVELNGAIRERLFTFSPSVKGNSYWITPRTIRFVPDSGQLKAGKSYTARFHLGKVLKTQQKFNTFNFVFRVNEQNFTFDPLPYSPMGSDELKWNQVTGTLRLANKVSPEKLLRLFEL